MKYLEVKFTITSPDESIAQDARDLLAALAGDAGFEAFEETEEGLTGYVQQAQYDPAGLDTLLQDFPLDDVSISYTTDEADNQDWNAAWEAEGFEPILVEGGRLVVHDGRHLPQTATGISIEIDAKLAFGTGNHETTRLMLAALLDLDHPRSILDCGTGTGILAIAALKLGAEKAVGYDIDEWSADNARHNAVINQVDGRFTALLGDAEVLDTLPDTFDVVTANINRNILLNDLPRFVSKMHKGSTLLLSGFYEEDIPLLVEKANEYGLSLIRKRTDGEWACIGFSLRA